MIKLSINQLELPVFDIIWVTPISVPLEKGKNLLFKIPTVNEYFTFEAKYIKILSDYFKLFSSVNFLAVKEFSSKELKENMMGGLRVVMKNMDFLKDFSKIIEKYFTGDFDLKDIYKKINPFQLSYLFLFIHSIVENVKKNFQWVAAKLDPQMSEIFSIFSRGISIKIEPRF